MKCAGNICKTSDLPEVPNRRYFTIGEASHLCNLKPHILRYWEQEFSLLAPTKRRGNRRYYQHQDIMLVRTIRRLLYEEGYTLQGAKAKLSQFRTKHYVQGRLREQNCVTDEGLHNDISGEAKISSGNADPKSLFTAKEAHNFEKTFLNTIISELEIIAKELLTV